jgi:hypothetical protein
MRASFVVVALAACDAPVSPGGAVAPGTSTATGTTVVQTGTGTYGPTGCFAAGRAPGARAQLTGQLGPADATAEILGLGADAGIGYAVGSAGDVNADGWCDVLVGTTNDDAGGVDAGALHVLLGPITGQLDVSSAVATWTGTTDSDHAGWVARPIGDVNGDGFDDVLGQAHRYDAAVYHEGMAFVAFGPVSGQHLVTDADIVIAGSADGAGFGLGIAGIGDVNADGRDDLAVGAGLIRPGAVHVFHDALVAGQWTDADADATILGEADGNGAGQDLAALGDASGDGIPDLLIADFWYADGVGGAWQVDGPFAGSSVLEDAVGVVRGAAVGEHMAIRVAATDLDGDGLGDPVVQSYDPNVVYLFPGGLAGETLASAATATLAIGGLGEGTIAAPGDLDGDGTGDLVIAEEARVSFEERGGVLLFYGPLAGSYTAVDAHATLVGDIDDRVGTALGAAGDVDADGYPDLLVGAQGVDGFRGAVYLFDGF